MIIAGNFYTGFFIIFKDTDTALTAWEPLLNLLKNSLEIDFFHKDFSQKLLSLGTFKKIIKT